MNPKARRSLLFQVDEKYGEKPKPNFLNEKIMDSFLKALKPLKEKIWVIMFGCEYLNEEEMELLKAFMDHLGPFLKSLPDDNELAIESRNKNFHTEGYFKFLESHKGGHVFFVDSYFFPPAYSVFKKLGRTSIANRCVVVRPPGPHRPAIEKKTRKDWAKTVEPRDQRHKEIPDFITMLIPQKVDKYACFNNPLVGSAPLSI